MPTGNTHRIIDDPTFDFRQYIWLCARAMGAAILLRDDPSRPITQADIAKACRNDGHYEKQVVEREAELAALRARTDADWEEALEREHQQHLENVASAIAKGAEETAKYDAMLAQVQAWPPPRPNMRGSSASWSSRSR